jgi:DNA (cytosine-5)-methyltransferase 1
MTLSSSPGGFGLNTQRVHRKKRLGSLERAPTVVSMFAGCGGMDLGFRQAGFEIVWANEWDDDAVRTYRRNLCSSTLGHMVAGDVSACGVPSGLSQPVDVLLGGFPCQAFSNAGSRRGVSDDRGLLYKHCIRFARELQPAYVVFENVRGMLTIPGRRKRFVEEVCDDLRKLGYQVHMGLVNAADYGVPQNRLRVVIVGVRGRRETPRCFRFPRPVPRANCQLLGHVLLNLDSSTPNQLDVIRLNPQAYQIGRHVPEGGSWKDIPDKLLPPRLLSIRRDIRRYRWPNFYRRFSRSEIAGTITAAFKPENAGVWHPTEPRAFSVREAARIQSFPDDFVFEGKSVKSMYQMIGNAVPPMLARHFAQAIRDSIRGACLPTPLASYRAIRARGAAIAVSTGEMIYSNAQSERSLLEVS